MNPESEVRAATILRSVVNIYSVFEEAARWLRAQDRVTTAQCSCWMTPMERIDGNTFTIGRGEGFEISWYAEAELDIDAGLSYAMDLRWDTRAWEVELTARASKAQEEVMFLEQSLAATSEGEMLASLSNLAALMQEHRDRVLELCLSHYEGRKE